MFTSSSISKKLFAKLGRKAYRAAYVGEHVRRGIAAQIRAMRDQRGWNQGKLSGEMGKPQSVVSRLEDPSYGKVTVQTLLEVATTFDVALQIRFVPFSTFVSQTRDVSTTAMRVVSFADDFASINYARIPTSGSSGDVAPPVGRSRTSDTSGSGPINDNNSGLIKVSVAM